MKYTIDINIDLPVDQVIEIFDNPDNREHWQTGLISMKHLSGETGQPGAKTFLKFKISGRVVEMTETIKVRNFPEEFIAVQESDGIYSEVKNSFVAINTHSTRWRSEFIFKTFGAMKVIAALMPGVFKRQSKTYLKNFKKYAESA